MKKLALAIGFAAYVVFGASSGSLAASKIDNGAGVATNRDSRVWSETATNARLLFVNEAYYPETTGAAQASRSTETLRMICGDDVCITP